MLIWSNYTGWWDCVDIFKLPQSELNKLNNNSNIKYVFKTSQYNGETHIGGDIYVLGDYNINNGQLIPYMNEPFKCEYCTFDYGSVYASKTFYDIKNDRQILYGWIEEERNANPQNMSITNGWAGVITLPRIIKILNKTESPINEAILITYPINEINNLRIKNEYFNINNMNILPNKLIYILMVIKLDGMELMK